MLLQVYLAFSFSCILDCALYFVCALALAVDLAYTYTITHVLVADYDLGLGPIFPHVLYESNSQAVAVVVSVLLFELVKLLAETSWVVFLDSELMLLEAFLFVVE